MAAGPRVDSASGVDGESERAQHPVIDVATPAMSGWGEPVAIEIVLLGDRGEQQGSDAVHWASRPRAAGRNKLPESTVRQEFG